MVIAHIVPHAIDLGINPIQAASILSLFGGANVLGMLLIGRASDSIELDRIELFLGTQKIEEIKPPSCSHYYFESPIELEEFPEGTAQLQTRVFDTSGNMNVDVREVTIVGSPYRPDAPSGETKVNVEKEYPYTAVTTDPQQDRVNYNRLKNYVVKSADVQKGRSIDLTIAPREEFEKGASFL